MVDLVVIGSVVVGGAVDANDAAILEGTLVFGMGMEVVEVAARSLCLD